VSHRLLSKETSSRPRCFPSAEDPYHGLVAGWLVAHQGGWDEFLLVAAPLALIAGVLWLANSRAREFARRAEEAERLELETQAEAPFPEGTERGPEAGRPDSTG
jgi:hypothetical protein